MSTENLFFHQHRVPRNLKEERNNHKSRVLWFTGLSGSGKSTIANATEKLLFDEGFQTYILDGDNVRMGLNKDLGFSPEHRTENIRRITEVAKLFADSGSLVLTAFISPYLEDRLQAREIIGQEDFIEIYIKADLSVCESRDPKGLYKKARAGEIKGFTGIDAPYEAPKNPELIIESDKYDVDTCAEKIVDFLIRKNIINK
ncbi:MAG: adenylyl-sulfate kinase [Flavobacteriales bacterium]|nr:adenylyl-sulfate kinase [Flavobacteriales bacterium]MBO97343.1 adenylyl-sulfate kinase [Flavobacteriales bacterium]|tara:strand:+ start:2401 stop:3003 length:603 start_codon:yes stop_codon:yes gene_type:complete